VRSASPAGSAAAADPLLARSPPVTPPLVLLHAFPFDSRLFESVRPILADHVELITPDFRGFGNGPALGDPPPEPDLRVLAEDVIVRLDELGIDRAIIGGVSMGGYVALAMLRDHPDRVAGLVLIDTRSGADDIAALDRRRLAAERADDGEIATGAEAIAPLIAHPTPAAIRAELAAIAGSVSAASIAWAQRAMAARPDSTPILAGSTVPVLVMVGEHDAITPPSAAAQMADAADNAELIQLPGVGHLSPAEDPKRFSGMVISWLTRHF
jgi:pimeloyl-ACP methyl ester carboxylesterase